MTYRHLYMYFSMLVLTAYADNLFLPDDNPDLVDVPPFYDNIVRAQKESAAHTALASDDEATLRATLHETFNHPALQTVISIQFKGGAIRDLLQLIAHTAALDVCIDQSITGSIGAVHFKNKRTGNVLRTLCLSATPPLALLMRFDTWHIMPHSQALELMSNNHAIECDTRMVRKVFKIKQGLCDTALKVKIEQLCDKITGPTTGAWYCFVDDETGTVFAQGYPRHLAHLETLLHHLDRHVPQVRIDALVALVDRKFEHNLGFNWGGIYNRHASISTFGFVGMGGKLTDYPTPSTGVSPETFAFHLFTKAAQPIKFPIVFGGPDLNTRRLNIEVNAADVDAHARILLQPSIVTSHQETAEILIGQSIPITTFVEDVVEGKVRNVETVNFKDVGTILHVKPIVLPELNAIMLDILVEDSSTVDSVDPKRPPVIKTIRTKNKVCLRNGQTVAIGGLTLNKQEKIRSSLPLIARLPLIGWLFRGNRNCDEDNELIIFITPTLLP